MVRGPRKVLKAELGRYGYKVVKEANLKLRLKSNVEEVSTCPAIPNTRSEPV